MSRQESATFGVLGDRSQQNNIGVSGFDKRTSTFVGRKKRRDTIHNAFSAIQSFKSGKSVTSNPGIINTVNFPEQNGQAESVAIERHIERKIDQQV